MSVHDEVFSRLAQQVRERIGDGTSREVTDGHEEIFVALAQKCKPRHRLGLPGWLVFAMPAAASLMVLFAVLFFHAANRLPFHVGQGERLGAPGQWVAARSSSFVDITFEQGSRFRIHSNSVARVIKAAQKEVRIQLKEGFLDASIHGNKVTAWHVEAGPYRVTVLGTVFTVNWNPTEKRLLVKVQKGVVSVQGKAIGRHGVRLTKGDTIVADERAKTFLVSPGAKDDGNSATRRGGNIGDGKRYNVQPAGPPASGRSPVLEQSQIAAERPSLPTSHQRGVAAVLQTGTANQLWQLANTARHQGRSKLSNDALLAIRKRFPSSAKASIAAFMIGRDAMDKKGALQTAAQWFEVYLKESEDGDMEQEAYRRLMSVYQQTHQRAKAVKIAKQYLLVHPNGDYAKKAAQLVSN